MSRSRSTPKAKCCREKNDCGSGLWIRIFFVFLWILIQRFFLNADPDSDPDLGWQCRSPPPGKQQFRTKFSAEILKRKPELAHTSGLARAHGKRSSPPENRASASCNCSWNRWGTERAENAYNPPFPGIGKLKKYCYSLIQHCFIWSIFHHIIYVFHLHLWLI